MQNSDKALPRKIVWQSLFIVLHTCFSIMLTHLSQMDLPTLINKTRPFLF